MIYKKSLERQEFTKTNTDICPFLAISAIRYYHSSLRNLTLCDS